MYERLLSAANERPLHEGEWSLLDTGPAGDGSYADLVAWTWRHPDERVVVVVNLGSHVAQGHIALGELPPNSNAWDFEDQLSNARYRWTRQTLESTGLYVRLDAGRAHFFNLRTVTTS